MKFLDKVQEFLEYRQGEQILIKGIIIILNQFYLKTILNKLIVLLINMIIFSWQQKIIITLKNLLENMGTN